jgi:hypothetical protein
MEIRLNTLGQVIAKCWDVAEEATARAIAEKYPDLEEEQITFVFAGELRVSVGQASRQNAFAHAFLADLQQAFPELGLHASLQAAGLIARVNLHSRWHEGRRSGSDLGVIITQPSVRRHSGVSQVEIVRAHARALLVQAKLNKRKARRDGRMKWQSLTRPQRKILPDHTEYSALLLYRLEGSDRSKLAPFRWQPCRGHSIEDIQAWLSSGSFPKEISSADVIRSLSVGRLGTDARPVIESLVDPPSTWPTSIEIRVYWPDGEGPPEHLYLQSPVKQEAKQHVVQYLA